MSSSPFTVAECAARLGVSQDYIRDRIKRGHLRAMRALGRGYRIRPEWLDAFVASLEVRPENAPPAAHLPGSTPRRKRTANNASGPAFRSTAEALQALRDLDNGGRQ